MTTLKDYILANLEAPIIVPFDLRKTITIEDIAYAALNNKKFRLENRYNDYISSNNSNEACQETNHLILLQPIENRENVCLLYAAVYPDCHDNYYHYIDEPTDDDPEDAGIFSKEYLEECKNYAIDHGLENSLFGKLLVKLSVSFPDKSDDFQDQYLSQVNVKSARNV